MTKKFDASDFINDSQNKVLIAGYGSLLSQYSRKTFSKIDVSTLNVNVNGWQRGWLTRSLPEKQTYASAVKSARHFLSAKLIPLSFDKDFEKREQDYRFTLVALNDIELTDGNTTMCHKVITLLETTPIYICESLQLHESDTSYPVNYSYVDTCLTGCYETNGKQGIDDFFKSTDGWSSAKFYNDSRAPCYPRATPIENPIWSTKALIDKHKVD